MTGPLAMTIREGRDGLDIAEAVHAGETFTATSRNGATMKLARALVEAGAEDGPVEVRTAEDARAAAGRVRFTSPSLLRLARWTISERDRGGLYLERYRNPAEFVRGEAQGGVSEAGRPAQPAEAKAA